MDNQVLEQLFTLGGSVAVVTGGGGILCGALSRALARVGVKVAVLDLSLEAAESIVVSIAAECGGEAFPLQADVLDRRSLETARDAVIKRFGRIDILVNGAGGNRKEATANPPQVPFFDLPAESMQFVFNLNVLGTILASQVFGKVIADQGTGSILNISSMCAFSPLTKVAAYSAAKAGINNFTSWLAVYMSQNCSPNIRVNAIAPGFFQTQQNRYLLTDAKTGKLTARGQQIIDHTPMARFGEPDDLVGTVLWLLSPSARFVHGIVVPIDGGFNAFHGV